jgi:hypothetical protein
LPAPNTPLAPINYRIVLVRERCPGRASDNARIKALSYGGPRQRQARGRADGHTHTHTHTERERERERARKRGADVGVGNEICRCVGLYVCT